ncbi:uncharacterized protein [Haliotis cracherodii]|uniref:uncharacterized protein isoform X1 n=2 Tax=Haliotis cracherodii TaxID=6455 RepID=UPI0039E8E7ED
MLESLIHNITHTFDRLHIAFQQMTPSRHSLDKCQKNLKSCPQGHALTRCPEDGEYSCKQCGPRFFQPNENRLGDKCRWRKRCDKPFMKYSNYGSTVKDAICECNPGYHFENEDQRACVPNRDCDKGFGQGEYGVCENCIEKMMYSDVKNPRQKCKPLRNCEKESRCTKKKSNGTFDNECGPVVRDINDCSSIVSQIDGPNTKLKTAAIIGGVVGALVLLVLLVLLLLYRRKNHKKTHRNVILTEDQLEELKNLIIQKCEKDDDLSKKVLDESFSQIESRIERQAWGLAQDMFRSHPMPGKYELVVETYKDKTPRETIKGYLSEWKSWKGENHTAVTELFQCLRNCKRDDIVYEICNRLRSDVGDLCVDAEGNVIENHTYNRAQNNFCHDIADVFPCIKKTEKTQIEKGENLETTNKLLEAQTNMDPHTTGAVFQGRTYPTAPVPDETNGLLTEPEVHFHRQYSQPVQATT